MGDVREDRGFVRAAFQRVVELDVREPLTVAGPTRSLHALPHLDEHLVESVEARQAAAWILEVEDDVDPDHRCTSTTTISTAKRATP